MLNKKLFFLLIFITQNRNIFALRCYSCSVTASTTDFKCLLDPMSVEGQSVVNCNKKYCTILRQELQDPPGKINTFVRGCEEVPTLLNDVLEDPIFRTIYRSCSTDLCNGGDALQDPTAQKISPDGYEGENLLVPGLPYNIGNPNFNGKGYCIIVVVVWLVVTLLRKIFD